MRTRKYVRKIRRERTRRFKAKPVSTRREFDDDELMIIGPGKDDK